MGGFAFRHIRIFGIGIEIDPIGNPRCQTFADIVFVLRIILIGIIAAVAAADDYKIDLSPERVNIHVAVELRDIDSSCR